MSSNTPQTLSRLALSLLPLAALFTVMGLASRNSTLSSTDKYRPFASERTKPAPAALNPLRRILLERQYRHVTVCREYRDCAVTRRERRDRDFQFRYSIVQYNQTADESDPSVFQTTPLPRHLP